MNQVAKSAPALGYTLRQRVRFGHTTQDAYLAELSERNAEWRGKTPMQQLAEIDRRLGKGVGAKRQRAKLNKD